MSELSLILEKLDHHKALLFELLQAIVELRSGVERAKIREEGVVYDISPSKDWNQTMAARLLGISVRQLRRYARHPPDADWPGWTDPILLKRWLNQRQARDAMNKAMARSLRYKEGFTEAFRRK